MSHDKIECREATEADLPSIVSLLAHDPLGSLREDPEQPSLAGCRTAFVAISGAPNHQLIVAHPGQAAVGVLQLSFIPPLAYEGGWRAHIEGVRVAEGLRSRGVGEALFESAIARARARGCHLVQLTTDRRRPEALPFYLGMGFAATHDGLALCRD